MKVQNKVTVKEAFQYHEDIDVVEMIKSWGAPFLRAIRFMPEHKHAFSHPETDALYLMTSEGAMRVSKQDWVIRGVNGEFYPCKPDVFEKSYEPV